MNQAVTRTVGMPQEFMPAAAHEEKVDLRVYWRTFTKYQWSIIGLTFLVGLLAGIVAYSLPPIYKATATMLLKQQESLKLVSIDQLYDLEARSAGYYGTQLQLLRSRELAEKVVDTLKLTRHSAFDPAAIESKYQFLSINWRRWIPASWLPAPPPPPSEEARRSQAIRILMSNLNIVHLQNTLLVHISFESHDRKLAAAIPNALVDAYIENDLESKLAMTQKATTWLTDRLGGLRNKLEESEKALHDYIDSEGLIDISGVKSVAAGEFQQLNSELLSARNKVAELKVVYEQLRGASSESLRSLESIPLILNNPSIQSVRNAQRAAENKIAELSKRYGAKHPSMMEAQTELEIAKKNTQEQIQKVVASITREHEIARTNLAALEANVRQKEGTIRNIGRKEFQLGVLEREVEVNRQLYDMFLTRFKETDASKSMDSVQSTAARMVDSALVPGKPYKPQVRKIILMAAAAGFIIAIMLAFLHEYLDNTLKTSEDVEQKLGLPLLGILPKLSPGSKKDPFKNQLAFLSENSVQGGFVEAIRTIRTGIMLSGLDNPHKVLLVTSAVPNEGKTTFAINQAFALGQVHKTLLIDADMRRPSVGKIFGLSSKAPGLSDLVAGTQELNECIHTIEGTSIDVLPSGQIPPNPLELLSSQRFKQMLAKLEDRYEQIVIDSAPTHAVSDALILGMYASSVVYVVKADHTTYKIVEEGTRRLKQTGVNVSIVLNQVDLQKLAKYYSSYGYGKYYGASYYGYGYYGKS